MISDIDLPVMSGWELARALRQTFGNQMRLVAVTSRDDPDDRCHSLAAGFDMHLVGPSRLAECGRSFCNSSAAAPVSAITRNRRACTEGGAGRCSAFSEGRYLGFPHIVRASGRPRSARVAWRIRAVCARAVGTAASSTTASSTATYPRCGEPGVSRPGMVRSASPTTEFLVDATWRPAPGIWRRSLSRFARRPCVLPRRWSLQCQTKRSSARKLGIGRARSREPGASQRDSGGAGLSP